MNLTVSYLEKIRLPFLHKLYKDNYPSGKPKGNEEIVVLETNKKIIGSIRIKAYEDCHFLTGMMITKEMRQQNLGSYLLQQLAPFLPLNTSYCLCEPSLTNFYIQNSFKRAEYNSVPNSIKVKYDRYTKDGKTLDILVYKNPTI
ncbi:GNAT family N-acetyltransferase [Aliivibrio sifiae]|uniref:GNAT family acetyltransferase n=1 Tax=Aliivibrio sifiae TaxID=566293 RepID=A0A2S7XLI1_9GAMM|nr:GNAT family N-acetyltransferase [Aliivibrio sifiae]PQJ94607.1 GNAT family acetyltransferase [Aliivibrio sifiae]GLR77241.1 N-acetyltransferase [Aliivibrio sifiae]